ncbi:MAG: hypothetical protein JW746_00550 [Candidatus Krumholzibacteriota bacterium]|nr:hypothetical protein [Candidatus Krumholzibacteriota bacterium]
MILVTLAGGVISAAGTFLISPRYISTAAFMPAGLENELTGGGGYFSNLGALGETYSAFARVRRNFIIDYIVRSGTMSRLMSERFGLREIYDAENEEEVRKKLMEATGVDVMDEGILEIAVESEDPVMAKDMAQAYLEYIESLLVSMSVKSAGSKRKYLENEVKRRKHRISEIDTLLQEYTDRTGIFDIQEQARAAFLVLAGIAARENMLEVEKRVWEISLKESNLEMMKIDLELEKLEEHLSMMMEEEGAKGITPPLSKLPELATEYMSLAGEKMMQEFSLAFVMIKLEDARISESSDEGVIRIIDPPYIPEIRSWPKRKQIVIIFTLASLFWCLFFILLYEEAKAGLFKGWKERSIEGGDISGRDVDPISSGNTRPKGSNQ